MSDNNEHSTTPIWIWIVGGLGFLWSLGGLFPLYEAFSTLPFWMVALFALNVGAAIFGCVVLLMRKAVAPRALLVSLIAVVLYIASAYATGVMGTPGGPQIAIVGTVAVVSLVLWAVAAAAANKGLLSV